MNPATKAAAGHEYLSAKNQQRTGARYVPELLAFVRRVRDGGYIAPPGGDPACTDVVLPDGMRGQGIAEALLDRAACASTWKIPVRHRAFRIVASIRRVLDPDRVRHVAVEDRYQPAALQNRFLPDSSMHKRRCQGFVSMTY